MRPTLASLAALATPLAALALLHGCGASSADEPAACARGSVASEPRVAANAAQAWPDRGPAPSPALTREEILAACADWAVCTTTTRPGEDAPARANLCLQMTMFSLERATPLSFGVTASESAEVFVRCVTAAAGDCGKQARCLSDRSQAIGCEEAGCSMRRGKRFEVTCAGDTASISIDCADPFTRDCARAGAACDATSPTGCTDRPVSLCPPDDSRADRCDGTVRLGCDGKDTVSYHDCARLAGGTCQADASGKGDCVFVPAGTKACGGEREIGQVTCAGGKATVCLYGVQTQAPAPAALCPP
jgi:hypothetical protein